MKANFSIMVREISNGYLVEFSSVTANEREEYFCGTRQQLAQKIEEYVNKAVLK